MEEEEEMENPEDEDGYVLEKVVPQEGGGKLRTMVFSGSNR